MDVLNRVQGKDNCLREQISLSRWIANEAAVAHLLELLKIETGNYRRCRSSSPCGPRRWLRRLL